MAATRAPVTHMQEKHGPAAAAYTLSDGRRVTKYDVAQQAGISVSAAAQRLRRSTNASYVLSLDRIRNLYRLDDGRFVTIKEVREHTGLSKSRVSERLASTRDPKQVFAPRVGSGRRPRKNERKPGKMAAGFVVPFLED
ncbi:MAG: hypothetical protein FKY71_15325 [Spiribacter salinus]|uniref:Uncharacterized protein n=1 Tax=Spiribacter salinus TaxID=1335746 RepID=A0A540VN60_9GAMM|nr:MAG: hypothetical protein FKY71_15325 [Spiribacter salinus]